MVTTADPSKIGNARQSCCRASSPSQWAIQMPAWTEPWLRDLRYRARCGALSPRVRIDSLVGAAGESSTEWAASSAGRAPRSQRGGRRFEPCAVHQLKSLRNARLRPRVLCVQRLVSGRCGCSCVQQFAPTCDSRRARCLKHQRNRYGRRRTHSGCSGLIGGNAEVGSPLTSSNTTSVSREPPADLRSFPKILEPAYVGLHDAFRSLFLQSVHNPGSLLTICQIRS